MQSASVKASPLARMVRGVALAVVVVLTVAGLLLLCPTTARAEGVDLSATVIDKAFAKTPMARSRSMRMATTRFS